MNRQLSSTIDIGGSNERHWPETHPRGRWLVLARIGWITLTLFMLGAAIASLPMSFAVLHLPCTVVESVSCNGNGLLTPDQIQGLVKQGFSLDAYAWSYLGFYGIMALFSIALGVIIFWRRSNDWMALLVALMCIALGAVNVMNPLQYGPPSIWVVLQNIVLFINGTTILFTLALFPNGRFVPRWSRWVAPLNPASTLCYLVFLLLLRLPTGSLYNNPVNGVTWWASWIILSLAQVYRYFRVSSAIERQQTKWVAFCFFIVLVGSLVSFFITPWLLSIQHNGFLYVLIVNSGALFIFLMPLSIALAILRYRLWDIDVIINKALVYGLLTLLLAAAYAGMVLGLQALLGGLLHQTSAIALVVSTLAIYALFRPLRSRIQAIIDRRFYRKKYNAARTLAAFNAMLRTEVDLNRLSEHLLDVVQETMQSASVSLWLHPPASGQSAWREVPAVTSKDEVAREA
ncbi:MAG TPA: hypothetical protein VKT25_02625 [Ktedonobacteraceae bacterium]|nr:hypothetical protein [Ktedonobacteraceae bacterium]